MSGPPTPGPPSDQGPPTAGTESTWLDAETFLEPVHEPLASNASDPIVVDLTGRMWRLRQRPVWAPWLVRALALLVGLLVLAGLFALRI